MSAACASSSAAATVRMRSPSARAASNVALPPIGMPRLAQVPPPYGTTAVSPEKHRHVVERNIELVGDDLRERRVGALALVGDADEGRDGATRLEPHGRSLLARDRRAPDAVELGARAGELDEAGEPDSHVAPSGAGGLLFPPQPIVVAASRSRASAA
jgi:hypothetical protein